MNLPENKQEKQDLLKMLNDADLQLIAQHSETLEKDFERHKHNFTKRLYNLADANPKLINSQTGKDYYTFNENQELLKLANSISDETGIKIIHETHRGKFSFALHITNHFLDRLPWLRLTLDMSHWCNVSESLLEDQQESLELPISRTEHIHARIGFMEGPQVNDPRAPEWQEAKEAHLRVWDKVVERLKKEGRKEVTITPEFGPYPYMPQTPFERTPLTSQWEANIYMKDLLKERYLQKYEDL